MGHKLVLVFPGQGSQYVGMSRGHEKYFELANSVLGLDLLELSTNGPNEKLALTEYTQPAIVAQSLSFLEKLRPILSETKRNIDFVLGHSVGEYAALSAAGVLDPETAIRAVHFRGKFMQEAVAPGIGGMTAVLRSTESEIIKACKIATEETRESVQPANYNEPGQIVISGTIKALEFAEKWITENSTSRARTIRLNVSAPFHSQLMQPAEKKLKAFIEAEIRLSSNKLPYLANLDAKTYQEGTSVDLIKANLIGQVCGSVQWTQSIISLPEDCQFIEVGPGKILQGLIKKIRPESKILSLDGNESGTWRDFLLS